METSDMRQAIVSRASQDAQALVGDAKERAGEALRKARQQWQQRLEAEKARLLSESRREAARIIAQAELQSRQELLRKKDAIISEMVGRVREKLAGNNSDEKTLEHLILEAMGALQTDQPLKVLASAKDLDRLRDLVAGNPDLKARISQVGETMCIGGVICESADGRVSVDNTFDTRIGMLVPKILPQVGRILFGDDGQ